MHSTERGIFFLKIGGPCVGLEPVRKESQKQKQSYRKIHREGKEQQRYKE